MYMLNTRYTFINGWIVDLENGKIINPDLKTYKPLKKLLGDLQYWNWDEYFKQSDHCQLYCDDSSVLFGLIEMEDYNFLRMKDHTITREKESIWNRNRNRNRNRIVDIIEVQAHKISISNHKVVYLHYHPITEGQLPYCRDNFFEPSKIRHQLINVADESFLEIDGFLVNLISRQLSSMHSKTLRAFLSLENWLSLKSVANANSLEKLQNMTSNYIFTERKSIFHVLEGHVYVNFRLVNDHFVCQKCDDEEATHIAHRVSFNHSNGSKIKYVVYQEELPGKELFDYGPILKQTKEELSILDSILNGDINSLELEFTESEEVVKPSCRFIFDYTLLKLQNLNIDFEVNMESCHHSEYDTGKKKLINLCQEKLESKFELLKDSLLFESDPWFGTRSFTLLYRRHERKLRENIEKIVGIYFTSLLKQFSLPEREVLIDEIPSKRYIIVDRFLIDIVGKRVVDPMDHELLKEMTYREREITFGKGLYDWNLLLFNEDPIPTFSTILFNLVEYSSSQILWDRYGDIHLQPTMINANGSNVQIRRTVAIDLKENGIRYIYEAKPNDFDIVSKGLPITDETHIPKNPSIEQGLENMNKFCSLQNVHESFRSLVFPDEKNGSSTDE
ncbi:uncharacterized protein NDAI_0D05070 [Naumovozyma dairenensis CBS 421]|uniref:Sir1 ORC-binding domain-containing protein n=1 Tax=Naumovozyma dairenensis (strain ATCC 10597 / BCRC 20456 / CBS 421 / NBRC 0211 / NRRL Y-12639) TaxID=1071378 RepID=G0WAK9_NAUDC|nr:hypothetical protein NDAI_0D05070 [Naumovozyma dairenensis CBS 421]CCD24820.1 hypothetical protein NDAI_0D05070 [Naumovozyma dairenensis CBS 421]